MHIAVFLFGFTAILGKEISLREVSLVWHRLWITVVSIAFVPGAIAYLRKMSRQDIWRFMLIGVLTCTHWLTFYGSIKLSNVSIALSCLATTSLFTSFLEPLFFKRKIDWVEVALGIVVFIGILIITQATFNYWEGIVVGLIAALLAAVFSTLNKKYMAGHNPFTMTILELGSGFVLISLFLPLYFSLQPEMVFIPTAEDWLWLLVLSIFCTSVAYILSLLALKELSAYTANLSLNLEPVYGILMAMAIYHEHEELSPGFYAGTVLILASVFLHPILKRQQKKRQAKLTQVLPS